MPRRRTCGRRSRKGGNLAFITRAAVPAALLAMQQTYRRKKHGGRKSRRHSKGEVGLGMDL